MPEPQPPPAEAAADTSAPRFRREPPGEVTGESNSLLEFAGDTSPPLVRGRPSRRRVDASGGALELPESSPLVAGVSFWPPR